MTVSDCVILSPEGGRGRRRLDPSKSATGYCWPSAQGNETETKRFQNIFETVFVAAGKTAVKLFLAVLANQ